MSQRGWVSRIFCAALLGVGFSAAAAPTHAMSKAVVPLADRSAVQAHFRSLGYATRGGVDKATTDHDQATGHGLPHFASSFTTGGVTYPFTMIGYPPTSGRSANLRSVIIPLRVHFLYFGTGGDVAFDPAPAVRNIVGSPIYVPSAFPNGVGQFGDQLQRAAFWNRMDAGHNWHVRLGEVTVAPTVDLEVTPETGVLYQDAAGNYFGDILFDFVDAQALTIMQLMDLGPDVLPIFVTDNVTAQALGYHSAGVLSGPNPQLQTYIYTSWLDPALVDPLFADVSTINHEVGEWLNDPFIQNIVPTWAYPPASDPNAVCSFNPFLEVGDPQGNGPTYVDFPTVGVTTNGTLYHLQQVVLWQWFADEVPSSAFGGWYTFPQPSSLKAPAVYCP